jgi:uridine kinase
MAYSLKEINSAIRSDPKGFAETADERYQKEVCRAAERIAANRSRSRVILLSGPSGSGKTTTAMKIEEVLDRSSIETHTISMDNYLMSVDPRTAPRDRDGGIDYESPFCLDVDLLNRHFSMLDDGKTIHIPKFEYTRQMRSPTECRPLQLKRDEMAIFEGNHALNDVITGRNPQAFKLYIAARSNFTDGGETVFEHGWTRLCRRVLRDAKYRGIDAAETLHQWHSVDRGEKLYIAPFRDTADLMLDTTLPYELSAMKPLVVPMLEGLPQELRDDAVESMLRAFDRIEAMDDECIARDSMVREFIGGSCYSYPN